LEREIEYESEVNKMEIIIRNITKDTMADFNNDHTINLPMDETKLRELLGDNEWIIVDSPVGEELTNITELNKLLTEIDYDDLMILSETYLYNEIKGMIENGNEYTIIDFNATTANWGTGNGVAETEEYKGFVLFDEGYANLPFEYTEEMEDYIRWEEVWATAECEDWREIRYNGNLYLVKIW
jgi:hypothetical protein